MDDSVIEINDSVITVHSDADMEDGEVSGSDVEFVDISAKSPTPPAPTSANETAATTTTTTTTTTSEYEQQNDELVFEVKFAREEEFDRLQHFLYSLLQESFPHKEYKFRRNTTNYTIEAYVRGVTPPPTSPSPPPSPTDGIFLIDTEPARNLDVSTVPSYKRANTDILDEDTPIRKKLKEEAANKCHRPKGQSACFNCGDTDHGLRDCPEPRDQQRIQQARSKRTERYHVDTEQSLAHIRPGKIGTKTRHAMGYNRGELPFFFYRMRVLGYPPAWLEEAKVQSSGMALFNADGNEVQGPDEEEGESDGFKYDVNKIIEFPGFNVRPGDKFFDDYKHHNVPCFQEQQLKQNFIKLLGENVTKGYKRKKLIDLPTPHDAEHVQSTNLEEHDMDLEDDEETITTTPALQPPLPLEPGQTTPPPPPAMENKPQRDPSPSLEDLRAQQEQLLEQLESTTSLNESSSSVGQAERSEKTEDTTMAMGTVAKPEEMSTDNEPKETSPDNSATESSSVTTPPATSHFRASIEGTPILKFSEFNKLPTGDKFKAGVSDVINFENLPDSTGKYEQMKGLLKNVRQQMVKLQNSDD